ncbi:type II toxin-antitoxin system YafO family toxin [Marinobacter xestospongiae]|uniref:Type II toxin-antitoxin system YafO family toxin n=1 Tax=Marinobacter xestospongiae TaxID=994319 RepID=A0ABU3W3E5_9GAMM|nr:type II toxin-antitoxin system YafO family toxin [Marinobacter xestospongiae]MDV2081067.1 type II toxin-antitoxin system YafO family toxin [Marinobacter xestospongiae]
MEVKVFTSSLIRETMPEGELSNLVKEFREYKRTGLAPLTFGRDASYNRPDSVKKADMHHIHLKGSEKWSINIVQFRRLSNLHLIYCRGFMNTSAYLLIAVIDRAHERARDLNFMLDMAEIAEKFRSRF